MTESILILSTGRTGTKFFSDMFKREDTATTFHTSPNSTTINVLCNMVLDHLLPNFILEKAWFLLKSNEVFDNNRRFYIDSNNHLYALPYLQPSLYPNLKVLHIIRDPRDYARSHLNWAYQRKKSYFANFILPFWQPNGVLTGEVSPHVWAGYSQLERFAWIWKFKNSVIKNVSLTDIPYYFFRFEDYFGNQNSTIQEEIIKFIGLDGDFESKPKSEIVNSTNTNKISDWKDWNNKECALFHNACGMLMKQYQYGIEDHWKKKVQAGLLELNSKK